MLSIYFKEMKQYFHSMTAYVFLAVTAFFGGFLFVTGNLMSQNGDIKIFFSSLFNILLFLIPMLTMRQFAEEQKLKTQQLLFTLPLSLADIVLGKFLATLSIVGIGLALTFPFPLILASLGVSAPLVTLGNYLVMILMTAAVVSIGLYISTLTENQVVSAIVSYGIILILWLIDSLAPYVDALLLKRMIALFSLKSNYIEFSYGIFNPASLVYFISLCALFLVLTMLRLDGRRQ